MMMLAQLTWIGIRWKRFFKMHCMQQHLPYCCIVSWCACDWLLHSLEDLSYRCCNHVLLEEIPKKLFAHRVQKGDRAVISTHWIFIHMNGLKWSQRNFAHRCIHPVSSYACILAKRVIICLVRQVPQNASLTQYCYCLLPSREREKNKSCEHTHTHTKWHCAGCGECRERCCVEWQ